MQKNVSRFYYTHIFLTSLFYYKYFIIILFLSFCKKKYFRQFHETNSVEIGQIKNNINAQRKDLHTVKDPSPPLTIFLTSNTFFSKMALQ